MSVDYEAERQRHAAKLRSTMNMTMGSLFSLAGLFFLLYRYFGIKEIRGREPSDLDFVIGGICLLYGVWRFSRAFKKEGVQ